MNDAIDHVMAVMETSFDPAWGEAWTRRQVSDALLRGNCHLIVVDQLLAPPDSSNGAAGFLLSRHVAGEEELLLLAVRPELRGKAIGSALIGKFIEAARARGATRLFLEMREGNFAEHLYKKHGFKPVGRRRNYYNRGSDNARDAITFGYEIPI